MLALLQESGPSTNVWLIILGMMGTAMGVVFAALMLEMRTRRERAEKLVDGAAEDRKKETAVFADLTLAVREQTSTLKTLAESRQRDREILETIQRMLQDAPRGR
jgi:flagellar biosynthesis/type III secretory pathway M-ring protein FliF/YscJ